ncbi:hypothetical protein A6769_37870 [Nostoc punctiforme NIES-2108]|uniref:Transposase IS4-like domain-containing protein n=1 Tax=Nostoc punctiforme NIES-2108 TaxID=1356359 RepID=A0A367S2R9_NOSPU|nr:hypothetical protein A6769_37870 [Nostoc punctiforme NIES-2108]
MQIPQEIALFNINFSFCIWLKQRYTVIGVLLLAISITNFNSVGMVESVRSLDGQTTVETRYFISSLESDAKQFGNSIRSHWAVENSLHWVLDVALKEDNCRIRKDNAPQNFAILRHIAVNLLTQEKRVKRGIKNKQFLAAMDNKYLLNILVLA